MNWHVEKRLPWRTDPRTVRVIERLLRQWPLKEPPAGLKEACLRIAEAEPAPEAVRVPRRPVELLRPIRALSWGATAILIMCGVWGLSRIQWAVVSGQWPVASGQWSVVSGQNPWAAPSGAVRNANRESRITNDARQRVTGNGQQATGNRHLASGIRHPPSAIRHQAIRRGENEPGEITQAEVESILRELQRFAQEVQEVQRGVEQARAQAQALQATAEVVAQDIATVAQAAREVADTSKATAGVLLAYFFGETPSWCEGDASPAPGVTGPDVAPAPTSSGVGVPIGKEIGTSSRQKEDGQEGAASGETPALEQAPSEPNAMPNDASEAEAPAPGPEGLAGTPAAVESQSLVTPPATSSDPGPTPGAADPQQSSMAPPAPVCAGPSPVGVSPRARLSAAASGNPPGKWRAPVGAWLHGVASRRRVTCPAH